MSRGRLMLGFGALFCVGSVVGLVLQLRTSTPTQVEAGSPNSAPIAKSTESVLNTDGLVDESNATADQDRAPSTREAVEKVEPATKVDAALVYVPNPPAFYAEKYAKATPDQIEAARDRFEFLD